MREAVIDLGAIAANVTALRVAVGGTPVMVVVKADGYGHGAVPVARTAVEAGAAWLGVADLTEALALREAGIQAPLLAWLHAPEEDFRAAVEAGVDVGVGSREQLETAAAAGATVQLKVDSGLGRTRMRPAGCGRTWPTRATTRTACRSRASRRPWMLLERPAWIPKSCTWGRRRGRCGAR